MNNYNFTLIPCLDNESKTNKSMLGSSPQQVMRQGSVTDGSSQQMGPGGDSMFQSNSPNFPGPQQQQQVPSLQANPNQQKPPGGFPNDVRYFSIILLYYELVHFGLFLAQLPSYTSVPTMF